MPETPPQPSEPPARAAHATAPVVRPIEGVRWQESLLQSYRGLHLGVQSVFTALVTGVAFAVPSADTPAVAVAAWALTTMFWVIARQTEQKTRDIVMRKGEEVSAWERAILLAEASAPEDERYYSRFKWAQRARRMADAGQSPDSPSSNSSLAIIQRLPSTLLPEERESLLTAWDALVDSTNHPSADRDDLKAIAQELLLPGRQVAPETVTLLLEVSGSTRTELDKRISSRLSLAGTGAWLGATILLVVRLWFS